MLFYQAFPSITTNVQIFLILFYESIDASHFQHFDSLQASPFQQYAPQQATPTQQYAQYVQQTAQQQPQQFGVDEINLSDDDLPF